MLNMTLTMVTILWSVFAVRVHFRAKMYAQPPKWLLWIARRIESHWCSANNKRLGQQDVSTSLNGSPEPADASYARAPSSRATARVGDMPRDQGARTYEKHAVLDADGEGFADEWKLIMSAADRLLFCLFMIAASTGVLLVLIAKTEVNA